MSRVCFLSFLMPNTLQLMHTAPLPCTLSSFYFTGLPFYDWFWHVKGRERQKWSLSPAMITQYDLSLSVSPTIHWFFLSAVSSAFFMSCPTQDYSWRWLVLQSCWYAVNLYTVLKTSSGAQPSIFPCCRNSCIASFTSLRRHVFPTAHAEHAILGFSK